MMSFLTRVLNTPIFLLGQCNLLQLYHKSTFFARSIFLVYFLKCLRDRSIAYRNHCVSRYLRLLNRLVGFLLGITQKCWPSLCCCEITGFGSYLKCRRIAGFQGELYGTFFDELCLLMTGFDRGQPPTEKQVS